VTPQAERIWALVSGLPRKLARKRNFSVLQAYVDGSGTGAPDVFVIAGYIATTEQWAKFSDEWQKLIDMKSRHYRTLEYFKMKEMTSDADRERCSWFYQVIEHHVTAAVSCVVSVAELVKVVRNFPWPIWIKDVDTFENPYFCAFRTITGMLAMHQDLIGISEPVDFIFDNETGKGECIDAWENAKLHSKPELARLMGDTPTFRDDKKFLPLQAADLYAYWVRQWELEGIHDGIEKLRFPWATRRDIIRMNFEYTEEAHLEDFNKIWQPEIQRQLGVISLGTGLANTPWRSAGWTATIPRRTKE
jgi:hypothetical protein